MATRQSKSNVINLRVQAEACALIDRAARVAGKTRTDFVVQAARREAEATLLDRRLYLLSDHAFEEFEQALTSPPAVDAGLQRLAGAPAPWER